MQVEVLGNTKNQWRCTEVRVCTNMHSLLDFTSYSLLEKELRGAVLTLTRMHLFLVLTGSDILLVITKGKGPAMQLHHQNQADWGARQGRVFGDARPSRWRAEGIAQRCWWPLSLTESSCKEIGASPLLSGLLWRFCYKLEDDTVSWQIGWYFSGIKPERLKDAQRTWRKGRWPLGRWRLPGHTPGSRGLGEMMLAELVCIFKGSDGISQSLRPNI